MIEPPAVFGVRDSLHQLNSLHPFLLLWLLRSPGAPLSSPSPGTG